MKMDEHGLLLPAHSTEAESVIIGALLNDNDAFDAIADALTESDFFAERHRILWRCIAGLLRDGKAADPVTVTAALDRTRELDTVGGIQAIGALANEAPTSRNIARYAQIVRDRAMMRKIGIAAMELGSLSMAVNRPPAELLSDAEALLAGLADAATGGDAETVGAYLVETVNEIERRMERGGEIQGLSTGLDVLDDKTCGLQRGDLILIASRPSIGKTSLGMQIAQNTAIRGGKALVFSLEMRRAHLIERMISNLGRVNGHALRNGRLTNDDWTGITAAMGGLLKTSLVIDDTTPINVTQMRAKSRRAKRRLGGLDLIVIDYVGLMDGEGEKRHEQVSDISRRLKALARELDVPVLALVQLNRKAEDRTGNRPKLSDLRDSGALEQDADVVMMLYRDEYYNVDSDWKGVAEINIAKQRMGETGIVRTSFEGEYSRFANLPSEYVPPSASMGPRGKRKGMDA